MTTRVCCLISCGKNAEFVIESETNGVVDPNTLDACIDHVGQMLTCHPSKQFMATSWRVSSISSIATSELVGRKCYAPISLFRTSIRHSNTTMVIATIVYHDVNTDLIKVQSARYKGQRPCSLSQVSIIHNNA